jgi:hypothetical protein
MSKADLTVYECHNPACTLGSRKEPGRFTGGITQAQAEALTGEPDTPYGDGYCPNCGDEGVATKDKRVDSAGSDPLDHIHAKAREILARRDNPADPLTKEEAEPLIVEVQRELAAVADAAAPKTGRGSGTAVGGSVEVIRGGEG